MKRVKFLHCADIHLDTPFTSLGGQRGLSSLRRQDLRSTFAKIINIAANEAADLLLISGDLFEHAYISRSTFLYINEQLGRIPHVRVLAVPGNHDPYIVNSCYRQRGWPDNFHILTQDKPYIFFEDISTCVYGLGFGSFAGSTPAELNIKPVDEKAVNILLLHGTIDMAVGGDMYNPVSSSSISALGMDYTAAGHFHNRIDDIGGKSAIYNPGSPEPLGFDETGAHGIYLGMIEKDGCHAGKLDIRFIETNERYYENIDVNMDGCGTDERAAEKILQAAGTHDPGRCLLSVTLKGYVEPGFKIDVPKVKACLEDRFFYLKIKDETMPAYSLDEASKEPGIKGLFARKMAGLISSSDDAGRKRLLINAFHYGMEALEQGHVSVVPPGDTEE